LQRGSKTIIGGLVVLFVSGGMRAQSARVSGEVTDQQKAVIPRAEIRVANLQTGIDRNTKTNAAGFYMAPYLLPGLYRVYVRAPGFANASSEDLSVSAGQTLVVNFQLRLGSATEEVRVKAGSQLLNTTDASLSSVVDREFVKNLPLNGRSLQTLITLAPGVQTNVTSSGDQGQFAVNGQRANANYFTIDGVSSNVGTWTFPGLYSQASAGTLPATNIQGGFNGLVSLDDLQEMRVLTSTSAPEVGRSPGAQVSLVTRSGTNQYHGAVYEYLRNEAFDANDWFANALSLPKPPLRLNDYGGTFGGPVRLPKYNGHDKTFFFFSYENQGFKLPQVLQTVVPSLAARQSATPDAAPILNAFPTPNGADLGLDGAEFNTAYGASTYSHDVSFRLDHRFNDNYSIFGRFNYSPSSNSSLGSLNPAQTDVNGITIQTYTVGATQAFNSRWVNDLRGNYTRSAGYANSTLTTFGGAQPPSNTVLWPGGKAPAFGYSIFNMFNVGGSYDIGFLSGRVANNVPKQYQVVDDLSYLHGAHQFKFGVDYRLIRTELSPLDLVFAVDFSNPNATTSGIVTLNSGMTTDASFSNQADETIQYKAFSLYAQDSWRFSSRLTLTYGIRWEVNPSPSAVAGGKSYTACCPGNLSQLTLSAPGAPFYPTSYKNFAPRLGVAYQLLQAPGHQLVVRGGWGIYYDLGQSGNFGDNNWPYSNFILDNATPFPVPPSYATFPPFNTVPSPSNPGQVTIAGQNFGLPRTLQWNVTLEQALGSSQVLSAAYVGARGRDLLRTESYLNPNPDFSGVQVITNNGFASYDSLQVQFTRRLTNGFQVGAAYTYSHSIDNASTDSAFAIPAQYVKTYFDKGNSSFDVRHKFSASFVYLVPTPKMVKTAEIVLHNWSIQGIFEARSALPFDVFASVPLFNSDPRFDGTPRANIVPGQPFFLYSSSFPGGKAANPAAFKGLEPNQVQGDLGRNRLRGFGLSQFDFSLMRRVPIKDKAAIEFRIEAFNIFNHPNFANPNSDWFNNYIGAPKFGQSASMFGTSLGGGGNQGGLNPLFAMGGSRDLQLALRIEF
jgi:hypothetical protein